MFCELNLFFNFSLIKNNNFIFNIGITESGVACLTVCDEMVSTHFMNYVF